MNLSTSDTEEDKEEQQVQTGSHKLLPYFLLCCTNLFWSLNFIIAKLVTGVFPPITLSLMRWGFPAMFFLYINHRRVKEHWPLLKRQWPVILALGFSGYTINSICVYEAVRHTTTINTSFINAFNPVLIALAGFIMYRFPVTARQGLGFLLSLLGVVAIIFKGQPANIFALQINIGDLFMVGSISFWAYHTILYKKRGTSLPADVLFTAMTCSGVIMTLPLALLENSYAGWNWIGTVTPSHLAGIAALCIFPSVLAYRFWHQALTQVSANKVAISQYLIPVFTTLISVGFLDEQLQLFHLLGGGLIFTGVFLVTISTGK